MSEMPKHPDWAAFAAWQDRQRRLPRGREADLRWLDEVMRFARDRETEVDAQDRLRRKAEELAQWRAAASKFAKGV